MNHVRKTSSRNYCNDRWFKHNHKELSNGANGTNQPSKHGGPGIPSVILGAFGVILFWITLLLGLVFSYTRILSWFAYSVIGTLVLLDTCLLTWGLILGIKGFYRKEYKAFFSIVGIILNSLMLFFILGSIARHLIMKYII